MPRADVPPVKIYCILSISILFIILLFNVNTWCSPLPPRNEQPLAGKGILDLRDWDFELDGPVSLKGEWLFCWNRFLTLKEFDKNGTHPQCIDMVVPGNWNGYQFQGVKISPHGYGTYKLRILLNRNQQKLAFKFIHIRTAYLFFINNKKISSVGTIGKTEKRTIPGIMPHIVDYAPVSEQLDIIIHVANFDFRAGGISQEIELGLPNDMREIRERNLAVRLFLFGGILMIGFYHLGLYILRNKGSGRVVESSSIGSRLRNPEPIKIGHTTFCYQY